MDADAKKTVLRMIPYGLYVLTSQGDPVGTGTINWVSRMWFDPPLVAMGVKKDTRNFANIKAGGAMALSFLGSGQGDLARNIDARGDTMAQPAKGEVVVGEMDAIEVRLTGQQVGRHKAPAGDGR